MESESLSMDPRYRAEFQRGYRGAAAPVPLVATPRVDEPDKVGMPPIATMPVESGVAIESGVAPDPPVSAPDIAEPEEAQRRRNPYVLAIPVVAIGFIGFGAWLLVSQFVWSYSGALAPDNSVERRLTVVLSYVFGPPLITVGLASLVGYAFWLAVRRHRRP